MLDEGQRRIPGREQGSDACRLPGHTAFGNPGSCSKVSPAITPM